MKKLAALLLAFIISIASLSSVLATAWVFPIGASDKRVAETTEVIRNEYEVFLNYCIKSIFGQESIPGRVNMIQMCIVVPTEEMSIKSDGYYWKVAEDRPFAVLCFEDTFAKKTYTYVGWNVLSETSYKNPGPLTATGEIDDVWWGDVCLKTCETNNVKIYIFDASK